MIVSNIEQSCRTPNNVQGTCIPLMNCEYLLDIFNRSPRISASDREFLQKSGCGFQGKQPKVNKSFKTLTKTLNYYLKCSVYRFVASHIQLVIYQHQVFVEHYHWQIDYSMRKLQLFINIHGELCSLNNMLDFLTF